MSQELMSAKFFEEPSEKELQAERKKATRSNGTLSVVRTLCALVVAVIAFGGGGFMVFNAVQVANGPSSAAGHGGHPALSMLNYCMSLVDLGWKDKVEKRIRTNPRPRPERPDVKFSAPDVPRTEGPIVNQAPRSGQTPGTATSR